MRLLKIDEHNFLVEYPPCCRTIFMEDYSVDKLFLSFPYVVFIVKIIGNCHMLFCGFRNKAFSSLNDYLAFPCLPNVRLDLSVCLGARLFNDNYFNSTHCTIVDNLLSRFWGNSFTSEYLISHKNIFFTADFRVQHLIRWAEATKKDKNFATSVTWTYGHTIESVVNRRFAFG